MPKNSTNAERVRTYLDLITAKSGGLDVARQAVEDHTVVQEGLGLADAGFEPAAVIQARAAIDSISAGLELPADQLLGLEAIINEDLRPAFDIFGGKFQAIHPLWAKLSSSDELRSNIERVIPSVGRLELPGNQNFPYAGTGFVVGTNLIMTNRHVAQLFASGVGDKRLVFLPGAAAGIDFLQEFNMPTGPTLMVRCVRMIHPYWDMAVLEVDGLSEGYLPLRLSLRDARDLPAGTEICVVGYPAYDPRNPAAGQNKVFKGRYGVKKLQPGQLQGAYDTASFGKIVRAMTHDCSTLGGNSGSAVFDPTNREVLGLHFGGLYHERNYAVPSAALASDIRVIDAGVTFAGNPAGGQNDWVAWWARADENESSQSTNQPSSNKILASTPATTQARINMNGATFEIPLCVTVTIGDVRIVEREVPHAVVPAIVSTLPDQEALVEPTHDTDLSKRDGYDPTFLSSDAAGEVPAPRATDPSVLAPASGGMPLKYQNFSITMHKDRRIALFTASNVTKEDSLRKPEAAGDYSRKRLTGLGKNDQEKWYLDPRLDAKYQLPDVFFTKDRGAFDKGHIVRREDVTWGNSYAEIVRANGDTFHVTNCSPQVADFNRSNLGETNWGDLENVVLASSASERLCVFAGPVLADDDAVFVGVGDGGSQIRARIPSKFWKVIVSLTDDGIGAFGFLLEQYLSKVEWEFVVPAEFRPSLCSLSELSEMTGVTFDAKVLAADQYETQRGQELVASGIRLRPNP